MAKVPDESRKPHFYFSLLPGGATALGSQRSGEGVSTPLDGSCFKIVKKPQTLAGSLPLRYRPWRLPLGEGRTASFMPLNPSTAVALHERLASGEPLVASEI